MKVFVDTNVIIENVIRRERFDVARRVIDSLLVDKNELYMSSGCFYTLLYVVDKYLRSEFRMEKTFRLAFLRNMAHGLLSDFRVAAHDNDSLLCSIEDFRFSDIEDSCQLQAAIASGCDYLLSFNVADYPSSDDRIMILSPEEFMKKIINE